MRLFRINSLLACFTALALAACGQALSTPTSVPISAPNSQNDVPSDVPTEARKYSGTPPIAIPTDAPNFPTSLPLPQPTGTATPVFVKIISPESPPAELGKVYQFGLYTHCGVDYATDFDGSFWDLSEWNDSSRAIGDPVQPGTMTLIDKNHARFEWDGGSIVYVRHEGPKIMPGGCY